MTAGLVALGLLAAGAAAADPSSSWMSYTKFDAGGDVITMMNVTVVVPAK